MRCRAKRPAGGLTVTLAVFVPLRSVTDSVATPTAFAVTLIFPPARLAATAVEFEFFKVAVPRTLLTAMVALIPGTSARDVGDRLTAWAAIATSGRSRLESQLRLLGRFIFSFTDGVGGRGPQSPVRG